VPNDDARRLAERSLEDLGFTWSGAEWTGFLRVDTTPPVNARVTLPEEFPDVLPEIRVDRKSLPKRVAHVEESGKVCIAPSSGVLIDADRPGDLVIESLERAESTIKKGLSAESDRDFQVEFLAYWKSTDRRSSYSICTDLGRFHEIVARQVTGDGFLKNGPMVLADNKADLDQWAGNLVADSGVIGKGVLVPLQTSFAPPDFDAQLSVGEFRNTLRKHASADDFSSFERWLASAGVPATILMSLPEASASTGRVLIGVRIERPTRELEKTVQKGFRPGHVPAWRTLQFLKDSSATRLSLKRLDRTYLSARGGAARSLSDKCVALIGIGAVGSEIAGLLAAAGLGELRMIDPEILSPDNVHRHSLGVRNLDDDKAPAVAAQLRARFPHSLFEARKAHIEELLRHDRHFITDADLIIVSVGDETLERRLNRSLAGSAPRIHAWVEPLGVGGHVLVCGVSGPGCFECLLKKDPEQGLVNIGSFVAPGQVIQKSLAGCAGTFSPFSAFDAQRTALEAASLAAGGLAGQQTENVLVSWRGDRREFEDAGFRLSPRGTDVRHGQRVFWKGPDFANRGCVICGARLE
jgi:hypothetical protein